MRLRRQIRIIKFWLKLIKSKNTLLNACYNDLYNCLIKGKSYNPWIDYVKNTLEENGFGYVWHQQKVDNESAFIANISQRIKDIYVQNARHNIESSVRCSMYKWFNNKYELQYYLSKNIEHKDLVC